MKILLLGDYSGVHNTLAKGLRELGHIVTVASTGDEWKQYSRDISLERAGKLSFAIKLMRYIPRMRGYDIVQLINPMFLELKAERLFAIYRYLRRHNRCIVMCSMGEEYYYSQINASFKPMRYSDYNIGMQDYRTESAGLIYNDWVGTAKERLNRYIARDCDAIVAGTYENRLPYTLTADRGEDGLPLRAKLHHIALPFELQPALPIREPSARLKVFIGIQRTRTELKGTDIMLKAAQTLQERYPKRMELKVVESIPYREYVSMMDDCDILMDQIYSYGPGMNALLALSKGIVTLSGGEPEHYDALGETEVKPIINVLPSYESIYEQLEKLILHPEQIPAIKRTGREYVLRNHDYHKIAGQYDNLYKQLTSSFR